MMITNFFLTLWVGVRPDGEALIKLSAGQNPADRARVYARLYELAVHPTLRGHEWEIRTFEARTLKRSIKTVLRLRGYPRALIEKGDHVSLDLYRPPPGMAIEAAYDELVRLITAAIGYYRADGVRNPDEIIARFYDR